MHPTASLVSKRFKLGPERRQETSLGILSAGLQPFGPHRGGWGQQTSQSGPGDGGSKQSQKGGGLGRRPGRCLGLWGRTRGNAQRYPNPLRCTEGWIQDQCFASRRFCWRLASSWCPGSRHPCLCPTPAPFCHQPPLAGDREAVATPAPTVSQSLGLIPVIRLRGSTPGAAAPRRDYLAREGAVAA